MIYMFVSKKYILSVAFLITEAHFQKSQVTLT